MRLWCLDCKLSGTALLPKQISFRMCVYVLGQQKEMCTRGKFSRPLNYRPLYLPASREATNHVLLYNPKGWCLESVPVCTVSGIIYKLYLWKCRLWRNRFWRVTRLEFEICVIKSGKISDTSLRNASKKCLCTICPIVFDTLIKTYAIFSLSSWISLDDNSSTLTLPLCLTRVLKDTRYITLFHY